MPQFRLAMSIMGVAIAAAGCGQKTDADRAATKVLRAEEVKISLGKEAASNSALPAAAASAASEAKAP